MLLNLPKEWIIDVVGTNAVLVHSVNDCWGTFEIKDNLVINGRFYCKSVPNNEQRARKDFAEREELNG